MGSEKLTALFLSVKLMIGLTFQNIRNGFPEGRNAAETLALYQQLVEDDGILALVNILSAVGWWWCNISFIKGDFDTRKSWTKASIFTSDQHSITIFHSYTNVTVWFLILLYWLNAEFGGKVRCILEIGTVGEKTGLFG